jgi:mannosylglycerate synthase
VSLVAFPFKQENPAAVAENVRVAAAHSCVDEVLCVGFEENESCTGLSELIPEIAKDCLTPVELRIQDRIGSLRPGKGDGMNTALRYLVEESDAERILFFDADITSFGPQWIDKAEEAADLGYRVVRHYFPRATTDAMITWMVTRTGFAILWPFSELSWIEQPLGGELLFARDVAEDLVADARVRAQSDWGIDTVLTFVTTQAGYPMYETYVAEGKAHRLYGRLTDLKGMLVEVFAAVQGLRDEVLPDFTPHRIEPPDLVPQNIAEKLGYNVEATSQLLSEKWDKHQVELLDLFPTAVQDGMLANRKKATCQFMDEIHWYETCRILLDRFEFGNASWEELLFKLWTVRVLQYTMTAALRGYSYAQRELHSMIKRYRRLSAMR